MIKKSFYGVFAGMMVCISGQVTHTLRRMKRQIKAASEPTTSDYR